MTDIVKIDPKEFGLEEQKAAQIQAQFKPMLDKMVELEKEYNQVIKLPIGKPETEKAAKELRLKYVKVRTGTAEIHKVQKAFYLAGGRFVDGWKNAQLFASQNIEEKLKEIEEHSQRIEAQRLAKIEAERKALIDQYTEIMPVGLGTMDSEVFSNYLTGLKAAHEARIEAERRAEEERQRVAAETKLHNDRKDSILHLWAYLDDEAKTLHFGQFTSDEWTKIVKSLNDKKTKHEAEQAKIKAENERLERERIASEKKAAEERAKAEAERKRIEAERQKELEAERKKQAELQAQLEAKEEAERKAKAEAERVEKERIEAEKKAALAPDKDKILNWINSMEVPACEVKSQQAKSAVTVIEQKFSAFKNWAISQTENL